MDSVTNTQDYDVVVYGATSFVGQILARYTVEQFSNGELKFALAGRSISKLAALKVELDAPDLDVLIADASDEDALNAMCSRTKVVVSTVGPYALYGEPLVKVCAETGTHYCDLTGEPQWIKRMLEAYEDLARQSGARIVHCCGFDSMPSDLGVHFMQEHALKQFGQVSTDVKMRVAVLQASRPLLAMPTRARL